MTQEEKDLLLKDLCARLSSYGVICQFIWTYSNETTDGEEVTAKENDNIRGIDVHTKEVQADYYGEWVDLEHCKPYLRPMSSMTEEEIDELLAIIEEESGVIVEQLKNNDYGIKEKKYHFNSYKELDWILAHHFDYRGLIPMGLALEAPKGMYKTD